MIELANRFEAEYPSEEFDQARAPGMRAVVVWRLCV